MQLANKSQAIADDLYEKIRSKELSGHIPSDKKIAQQYHVALMTANKALKILEKKGAVIRIPRKGTFAAEIVQKELKVFCNNNLYYFEALEECAKKWDPEVKLVRTRDASEADLLQWTTFTPLLRHSTDAVPFPKSREKKLRRMDQFWKSMVDLHYRDGNLYGIPYFFSPILLYYNRSLMRRIEKDFSPVDLTMEHFLGLTAEAVKAGYCGLDFCSHAVGFFLSITHVLAGGKKPALEHLLQAADIFKQLSLRSGRLFSEGKTLFALSPRHANFLQVFKDYDISPLPKINGERYCPAASCTFAVSSHAEDPERLFDLCEMTLEPEFQQAATRNRYGIAMDRNAAMNSMDTAAVRDDFFFSGVKDIIFPHYDYQLDTLQEISLLVSDYVRKAIDEADFTKGLHQAMQLQIQSENRRKRFSSLLHYDEHPALRTGQAS